MGENFIWDLQHEKFIKLMNEKYRFKLSEARHADASEGYNTDPEVGPVDQILTEDYINSRY